MNKTTTNGSNTINVEGRLGRLEGHYESLSQEVQSVGRAVTNTQNDVKDMVRGFNEFKDSIIGKIGTATAPKWPLIVSIGSCILTMIIMAASIVALLMSGQNSAITDNKVNLNSIRQDMYDANYNSGKSAEWRGNVNQILVDTDAKLQREMRLMNDTVENKVKNLDERLQREFMTMGKMIDNNVEELKTHIIDLRKWRLDHSAIDAEFHGTMKVKTEGLAALVEHIEHRQYDDRVNRLWMKELEGSTRHLNQDLKMSSSAQQLMPAIQKPANSGGTDKN